MTPVERRSEALEEIRRCVCKDRCSTHGDAEDNFKDIAYVWSWWIKARYGIEVPLDALDSAEMMNLMKSTRKAKTPLHLDHWIDGGGYNVCGAGIVKKHLEERDVKKELDGVASAKVDLGDEALNSPIAQNPMESIYGPAVLRCQNKDGHGNQCCLSDGHTSDHDFSLNRVYRP